MKDAFVVLVILAEVRRGCSICCIRECNTFSRFTHDQDCTINRNPCPRWFPFPCTQPPDCSGMICPANAACTGNTCLCNTGFYNLAGDKVLQSEVGREPGKATAREEGLCLKTPTSQAERCTATGAKQCGLNQECTAGGRCKCLAGFAVKYEHCVAVVGATNQLCNSPHNVVDGILCGCKGGFKPAGDTSTRNCCPKSPWTQTKAGNCVCGQGGGRCTGPKCQIDDDGVPFFNPDLASADGCVDCKCIGPTTTTTVTTKTTTTKTTTTATKTTTTRTSTTGTTTTKTLTSTTQTSVTTTTTSASTTTATATTTSETFTTTTASTTTTVTNTTTTTTLTTTTATATTTTTSATTTTSTTTPPPPPPLELSSVGAAAGYATGGVIVFLILLVGLVTLCRSRKATAKAIPSSMVLNTAAEYAAVEDLGCGGGDGSGDGVGSEMELADLKRVSRHQGSVTVSGTGGMLFQVPMEESSTDDVCAKEGIYNTRLTSVPSDQEEMYGARLARPAPAPAGAGAGAGGDAAAAAAVAGARYQNYNEAMAAADAADGVGSHTNAGEQLYGARSEPAQEDLYGARLPPSASSAPGFNDANANATAGEQLYGARLEPAQEELYGARLPPSASSADANANATAGEQLYGARLEPAQDELYGARLPPSASSASSASSAPGAASSQITIVQVYGSEEDNMCNASGSAGITVGGSSGGGGYAGEELYGATIGKSPPTHAGNRMEETHGSTIRPAETDSEAAPPRPPPAEQRYQNAAAERAAEVLAAADGIPAGKYTNVLGIEPAGSIATISGSAAAAAAAAPTSAEDLALLAAAGNLSAPGVARHREHAPPPQPEVAKAPELDSVEQARLEFVLGLPNIDRAEAKRLLEDDGGEKGTYLVRKNPDGTLVLSVTTGEDDAVLGFARHVEHYPISTEGQEQPILYVAEGEKFATLSAYVQYFKSNPLPAGTTLSHGVRQHDVMLSGDF